MCGIAGIWNCGDEVSAEPRLESMLDAMRHRGPDGRGTFKFAGGAAGMVRLALVDLSPRGQQPLWSPCGRVAILFNGEIYNFREERKRLAESGYSFQTTTDTEVILALFLESGTDFVKRLRGMYAVALFDWRDAGADGPPTLTLVRSPFGIKPLYVAECEGATGAIVFASEIGGLLASDLVPRRVDSTGLANFLSYGFVVQPRTIIQGVRMIDSGTWERYAPGRTVEKCSFWDFPPARPRNESFEESAERLRAELDESVRLHALADAPVGAFLSGGLDSTTIVSLMRRHVNDLRTYTLRFPDLPGHDEAAAAASTAERLECRHTVVDVTGREAAAAIPMFAGQSDQPSVDGFNSWLISRGAARDVKGVLSGVGGDEWFAGYAVVGRMVRAERMPWKLLRLPASIAQHLESRDFSGALPPQVRNLAARRSRLGLWLQPHRVFPLEQACAMAGVAGGDLSEREEAAFRKATGSSWAGESAIGQACLLDVFGFMKCQLLRDSDAASMAHSLELRVPFVDLKIAEFSRSCRDDYKLSPRKLPHAKRVLIQAVREVLPADLISAPKRGFSLPYTDWMRREMEPLIDDTCDPRVVRNRGLIDPKLVEPLFAARRRRPAETLHPRLWVLMLLELWLRAMFDGAATHVRRRSG